MAEIGIPQTTGERFGNTGVLFGQGLAQVGMRVEGDGYGFEQISAQFYRADTRQDGDPTPAPLSETQGIPTPGSEFLGGFVHKVSKTYGKGRSEMVTVEVVRIDAGSSGDPLKTVPQVEGTSTLSTEPIQTHPRFAEIAGTYKEPKNGSRWNPRDNSFVGFVEPTEKEKTDGDAPFYTSDATETRVVGVKSYYSPQVVVRGHFFEQIEEGGKVAVASKSGTYSETGNFAGVQLIPEDLLRSYPSESTTDDERVAKRTWLLSTVGLERFAQGKIIKVTFECILSGVFGWNPEIYESESEAG